MIVICVATDVLPALSLCMEPPEKGLLLRRPRNVKADRLADTRLIVHAYLFLGVIESLSAMSMAFWYLQRHGYPFSTLALSFDPNAVPNDVLFKAQSVYFFTLVLMQWGNFLATCGRTLSVFHAPLKNLYIFPAAAAALILASFFTEVPFFQRVFGMRTVPVEYVLIPITFGIALLVFDEIRKYFVRKYPAGFSLRSLGSGLWCGAI